MHALRAVRGGLGAVGDFAQTLFWAQRLKQMREVTAEGSRRSAEAASRGHSGARCVPGGSGVSERSLPGTPSSTQNRVRCAWRGQNTPPAPETVTIMNLPNNSSSMDTLEIDGFSVNFHQNRRFFIKFRARLMGNPYISGYP